MNVSKWKCLFCNKVTLTILDINRENLLKCAEDGQAMQVLTEYLEGIYNEEAMALSTEPRTAQKVRNCFLVFVNGIDWWAANASTLRLGP